MSDTDKTRPWWVKVLEHPREVHNHTNGVCELALGPVGTEHMRWRNGACYIDAQWWRREFRCGCAMCHGFGDGQSVNRRARYAARRLARKAIVDEC